MMDRIAKKKFCKTVVLGEIFLGLFCLFPSRFPSIGEIVRESGVVGNFRYFVLAYQGK